MELAYTSGLSPAAERIEGSTPSTLTICHMAYNLSLARFSSKIKNLNVIKLVRYRKFPSKNIQEKRGYYHICTTTMKNEEIAKWMEKLSIRLPLLAETAAVTTSWL